MQRFGLRLILISVLGSLLFACGAATPTTVPAGTAASVQPAASAQPAAQARFDGLSLNVLTFTGPQIAEAFQRRGPEWTAQTGAEVKVTTVPFDQLYQTALADLKSGASAYDVLVIPSQWLVDYVELGYLDNLTPRIQADPAVQWADIAPFFREFSTSYKGQTYAIPLDGDFHMVYYRSDLLEQAGLAEPQTWDDYLAVAKAFHGKDLNGDGAPDYGSCIAKKANSQSYWVVWSIAGAFLQSQGTPEGGFFDIETMKPLVNTPAFAAALDIYAQTNAFGPPDQLELDVGATRKLFLNGQCALSLDWGDIGTLALDPAVSNVIDKVGAVILPGTTQVLDRASGQLIACDKTTCPYAINGVNHAPYAAFGGWAGASNAGADARTKDATYAFLSFMAQPAQANRDVTIGASGFNPYRTSQFTDRAQWLAAGMSQTAAAKYLGALGVSLNSPNMVMDLRIPQNQRYQQVVLDGVLAKFLAGTISRDQAMQEIYDGWEAITNEVGRERQQSAYRATLGISR